MAKCGLSQLRKVGLCHPQRKESTDISKFRSQVRLSQQPEIFDKFSPNNNHHNSPPPPSHLTTRTRRLSLPTVRSLVAPKQLQRHRRGILEDPRPTLSPNFSSSLAQRSEHLFRIAIMADKGLEDIDAGKSTTAACVHGRQDVWRTAAEMT